MNSEIQFEKYKNKGANYHYSQINKKNLKRYRPSVEARYLMHIRLISSSLRQKKIKKTQTINILDVGCGDGVLLFLIEKKIKDYNFKFHGVDLSKEALDVAKKKIPDGEFKITDAYNLLFPDNYFDYVISSDVIEHVNFPEEMLGEIKRVTKNHGEIIIGTPIRYTEKPLDNMHFQEFFQNEFFELISSFFIDVKLHESHNLYHILNYGQTFLLFGLKIGIKKYWYNILSILGKNLFLNKESIKRVIYTYMFVVAKNQK